MSNLYLMLHLVRSRNFATCLDYGFSVCVAFKIVNYAPLCHKSSNRFESPVQLTGITIAEAVVSAVLGEADELYKAQTAEHHCDGGCVGNDGFVLRFRSPLRVCL